jgi:hypothetical protein
VYRYSPFPDLCVQLDAFASLSIRSYSHMAHAYRGLVVLSLVLLPAALPAQVRAAPDPFETLDVGMAVLADVNHGLLHRWWAPGPALGIGITTPFYLGGLEAGVQYAHPTALRHDVPGFRSLFFYAGWGGGAELGAGFTAGGGLRVGIMALHFDGDTLPAFRERESELGVVGRAAVRWMPAGTWFAEASVSYQSVLTHPRMEQVFLAGGLGRRFATPAWLRDFLD